MNSVIDYLFSDFGFLLESSPGGNLGFEVDFKLDDMYINLLGTDGYHCFVQLFILALLAVRYAYFSFGNRSQLIKFTHAHANAHTHTHTHKRKTQETRITELFANASVVDTRIRWWPCSR